jgi:hypothetical protein
MVLLDACVPVVSEYQRLEVPGARYFRGGCYGSYGPPSIVYYPYHGIFISLDITSTIALGIHLPAGTEVQLNAETVRITGVTQNGPVDVSLPIRAARQGALGNRNPPEFQGLRDPFTSPDNFGPLAGASESGRHIWYSFVSETDSGGTARRLTQTPLGLLRGTVELPPMTINGVEYGPQTLPFERREYAGTIPVNC